MIFKVIKYCGLLACLGPLVLASVIVNDGSDDDSDDYLLAKINCNVGDKYDYVMATQSSLFNENEANLQVKAKVELTCLEKKMWRNASSGVSMPAQLFQARITDVQPIQLPGHSDAVTIAGVGTGRLQMATLFANLKQLESDVNGDRRKQPGAPNVKLGAVNSFFSELSNRFGQWIAEVIEKLVQFVKNLLNKKRSESGPVQVGISLRCENDTNARGQRSRRPRHSFKTLDLSRLTPHFSTMFKEPFKFLQLEDGSIKDIQLSEQDTNANVANFKKFISQAFATQLDERKKTMLEESELGTHLTHYEMEYDEPEQLTPEQYMSTLYTRRAKRSAHMVSVIRRVNRTDLVPPNHRGTNARLQSGAFGQALDFSVQQVQLIHHNMLIASGGYFQSFFPISISPHGGRTRRDATTDESKQFDQVLRKFLNLDLQYSMVRVGKKPWKRSVDTQDGSSTNDYVQKLSGFFENSEMKAPRPKRAAPEFGVPSNVDVVCERVGSSEENDKHQECYEYRQFGSELLNAYYNRTIVIGPNQDRSVEHLKTKYKIGARILGEDIFMGKIDIAKNYNNVSKLRINLFGSEYVDLNLCDIRNKVFSQADSVPLITENLWFMTNVALKISYELDFRLDVPERVCRNESRSGEKETNDIILSRTIAEQMEIHQNTRVDLGAVIDASFLIFSGQMGLKGHFDMDSNLDFTGTCLSAKSHVRPMDVSLDFNYQFFHPVCGYWMEDSWSPRPLSWRLNREYRNAWIHNACM